MIKYLTVLAINCYIKRTDVMYYESLAAQLFETAVAVNNTHSTIGIDSGSHGETLALACLKKRGGSALPKEISADMRVSSARTAAIINQMEQKGLVERAPHPEDGRKTVIRLLPEGEAFFNKKKYALMNTMTGLLKKLGPDDASEYVRLQVRLADIIRENRSA